MKKLFLVPLSLFVGLSIFPAFGADEAGALEELNERADVAQEADNGLRLLAQREQDDRNDVRDIVNMMEELRHISTQQGRALATLSFMYDTLSVSQQRFASLAEQVSLLLANSQRRQDAGVLLRRRSIVEQEEERKIIADQQPDAVVIGAALGVILAGAENNAAGVGDAVIVLGDNNGAGEQPEEPRVRSRAASRAEAALPELVIVGGGNDPVEPVVAPAVVPAPAPEVVVEPAIVPAPEVEPVVVPAPVVEPVIVPAPEAVVEPAIVPVPEAEPVVVPQGNAAIPELSDEEVKAAQESANNANAPAESKSSWKDTFNIAKHVKNLATSAQNARI